MIDKTEKLQASLAWLQENYSHIWFNGDLRIPEKAGFLAAACNPTRCYLMTLSLRERLDLITQALRGEL
jgi:hypothetical protein